MPEIPVTRYCIECGNPIMDNYGFCTACGRAYDSPQKTATDSGNVRVEQQKGPSPEEIAQVQQAYQKYADEYRRRVIENQRKMNIFMLGIWVALSAFMAIGLFFDLTQFVPYTETTFGFGDHPEFEASVLLVSCLLAAISLACSVLKRFWRVAFISCLLSSVSTVALAYYGETICIYLFLFGFLATLRVKNIKVAFKD